MALEIHRVPLYDATCIVGPATISYQTKYFAERRFCRKEEKSKPCKAHAALLLFVLQVYLFLTVLKGNGFNLNKMTAQKI